MSNDILKYLRSNEDALLAKIMEGVGDPSNIKQSTIQEDRNRHFSDLMNEQLGLTTNKKALDLYKQANPQLTDITSKEGSTPFYLAKDVTPLATQNPDLNRILMAGVPGFGPETDRLPTEKQLASFPNGSLEEILSKNKPEESLGNTEKVSEKPTPKIGKPTTAKVEEAAPKETEVTPATQQMQEVSKKEEAKYSVNELEKRMNDAYKVVEDSSKMLGFMEKVNSLAKASGATEVPYQTSEYVTKMKLAQQKAEDYKTLIEEARKEEKHPLAMDQLKSEVEKARFEIGDKKSEDDPNSVISKTGRALAFSIAGQLGMKLPTGVEQAPYSVISKIMPQVEKALLAKEALDTKKEIAAQNAIERAKLAQEKKSEKESKRQEDFINAAYNKIVVGKPYAGMVKMQNALRRLEEASKHPSGIKDVGALYEMVKMFDPESVVREGEISLTKQASGVWDQLNTLMSKVSKDPRVLNQSVINQMRDYAKFIAADAKGSYRMTIDPVLKQAAKRGISKDEFGLIDPLYDDSSAEKPVTLPVSNSSEVVIRSKSTGSTVKMPREKADKFLKDPNFEEVK